MLLPPFPGDLGGGEALTCSSLTPPSPGPIGTQTVWLFDGSQEEKGAASFTVRRWSCALCPWSPKALTQSPICLSCRITGGAPAGTST